MSLEDKFMSLFVKAYATSADIKEITSLETDIFACFPGKLDQMNDKHGWHVEAVYIPATPNPLSEHHYLQKTIPIALQSAPKQICGVAHRVGFVYIAGYKCPIYRLKLRESQTGKKSATLPDLFILENGVFVRHEI